eukprot:3293913-Rhodomonas_salina.1
MFIEWSTPSPSPSRRLHSYPGPGYVAGIRAFKFPSLGGLGTFNFQELGTYANPDSSSASRIRRVSGSAELIRLHLVITVTYRKWSSCSTDPSRSPALDANPRSGRCSLRLVSEGVEDGDKLMFESLFRSAKVHLRQHDEAVERAGFDDAEAGEPEMVRGVCRSTTMLMKRSHDSVKPDALTFKFIPSILAIKFSPMKRPTSIAAPSFPGPANRRG